MSLWNNSLKDEKIRKCSFCVWFTSTKLGYNFHLSACQLYEPAFLCFVRTTVTLNIMQKPICIFHYVVTHEERAIYTWISSTTPWEPNKWTIHHKWQGYLHITRLGVKPASLPYYTVRIQSKSWHPLAKMNQFVLTSFQL